MSEASTLDCPKMEPLKLGCTWKGFGGNLNTCSIAVEIHKNRIELKDAVAAFNNRRLTVKVSTQEVDQAGLFDADGEQAIEVEGIADTAAISVAGDKYKFRLTFHREDVNIEDLLNCSMQNGTLTVTDISAKVKPEKAEKPAETHPDLQTGGDRPAGGLGAFSALSKAVRETDLAKLCHDGTDKPVLSEKVAFALAQTGVATLEDLQKLMESKPQFWEAELLKVSGLGKQKLEQLTEAFQMHMAKNAPADESRKNCNECGQCYVGPKCDNCGSEFFQAIHDETLTDEFEWPLDSVQREPVGNAEGITAEILLKEDEFGQWHYGVYISVAAEAAAEGEAEPAEYGYQPSLVGNKLDEETARARGLQAVADEMVGVVDDFPDIDAIKEFNETIIGMLPVE